MAAGVGGHGRRSTSSPVRTRLPSNGPAITRGAVGAGLHFRCLQFTSLATSSPQADDLGELWDHFDTDGNGELSRGELKDALAVTFDHLHDAMLDKVRAIVRWHLW